MAAVASSRTDCSCERAGQDNTAHQFPWAAPHLGKPRRNERPSNAHCCQEPRPCRYAHGREALWAPGSELHRRRNSRWWPAVWNRHVGHRQGNPMTYEHKKTNRIGTKVTGDDLKHLKRIYAK